MNLQPTISNPGPSALDSWVAMGMVTFILAGKPHGKDTVHLLERDEDSVDRATEKVELGGGHGGLSIGKPGRQLFTMQAAHFGEFGVEHEGLRVPGNRVVGYLRQPASACCGLRRCGC
eukprot:CAMPEP_0184293726 /NCGR_PEP_ID=MMETSP1049-20130417/5082_1 /TAXON_ID=77928 /ORGANISM="Proteomonas sulcata, Strain CCMP704" /LENGTH=117 /DNA_ID=CAMNT_0026601783 /DNA_START=839 /DNA_END=1192 /DNA_ORIENTATION=+